MLDLLLQLFAAVVAVLGVGSSLELFPGWLIAGYLALTVPVGVALAALTLRAVPLSWGADE